MAPAPGLKPRRIPQRTCVGCRTTTAKRQLVRVVRTPEQTVILDPTGRQNGRGAYVHDDPDCWQKALSRDSLGRVLHTTLTKEDRAQLEAHASSLAVMPSAPPER